MATVKEDAAPYPLSQTPSYPPPSSHQQQDQSRYHNIHPNAHQYQQPPPYYQFPAQYPHQQQVPLPPVNVHSARVNSFDQEPLDAPQNANLIKGIGYPTLSNCEQVAALAVYAFTEPVALLTSQQVLKADQLIETLIDVTAHVFALYYNVKPSVRFRTALERNRHLINQLQSPSFSRKDKLDVLLSERLHILQLLKIVYGEKQQIDADYKEVSNTMRQGRKWVGGGERSG